mgnify:CR=1 FL=1
MEYIHDVTERNRRMGTRVAQLSEVIAANIGVGNFVYAAEQVKDLLEVIFDFSGTVYDYDRPFDQWGLFCGAVSPHIEQGFSDLLYRSGINDHSPIHDGDTESPSDYGKPLRSDGFVYTEDDRPC